MEALQDRLECMVWDMFRAAATNNQHTKVEQQSGHMLKRFSQLEGPGFSPRLITVLNTMVGFD